MIAAASLSVSAAAEQTIDNLVNSANSIENTLQTAYKSVYGVSYYAGVGGIVQSDVMASSKLSVAQMDAYNNALTDVQNATYYTAQEFFEDQHSNAMNDLSTAVDNFATAALEISKVIEVADIAVEADTVPEQQALQTYITANDVELTQSDVAAYNQSLDDITNAAQDAAAFKAAANDESMKDIANNAASNYNQSLYSATASFSAANDEMLIAFASGQSLGFHGFFQDDMKSNLDVMGVGESIYAEQGWE